MTFSILSALGEYERSALSTTLRPIEADGVAQQQAMELV